MKKFQKPKSSKQLPLHLIHLVFQILTWKIKIINFKNSEFGRFRPLILKGRKGQNYFYGRLHSSLALLINH